MDSNVLSAAFQVADYWLIWASIKDQKEVKER